jgi:SNF2 family DNA or RNA helicase
MNVLKEAIEGSSAKALVIVPFKGIINDLAVEVAKYTTVAVINGDVSPAKRNQIIWNFKNTDSPHTLLCHPKVMAHGLNLTEADRTIFYAPIFSNDEFEQVIERFNRMGQKRSMTIIRIAAHFLEHEIYATIDERRLSQKTILDLYHAVLDA